MSNFNPLTDLSNVAIQDDGGYMIGLRLWDPETKRVEARYLPQQWITKVVAHKSKKLYKTKQPCATIHFVDPDGNSRVVTSQTKVEDILYWISRLDQRQNAGFVWKHMDNARENLRN